MRIDKVSVNIFYSYQHCSNALFIHKYEDGKLYVVRPEDLTWTPSSIGSVHNPILIDEYNKRDITDRESSLQGENQALKDEINFLRKQVELLLQKSS